MSAEVKDLCVGTMMNCRNFCGNESEQMRELSAEYGLTLDERTEIWKQLEIEWNKATREAQN